MKQRTVERFRDTYARPISDADRAVQREVFGKESWVRGYTTVQQADLLAERLALGSGMRLLDVGAGRGWPSLYLAQMTGCEAVITDIPGDSYTQCAHARHPQRLERNIHVSPRWRYSSALP